jgi:nicotinamidase-related amidase
MAIDPKTTALLLIEYQNDFTSEGGALHGGVKPVMESTNMLANTVQAAAKARAAGVTVMFAPISFAEGYREITPEPYGILKGVVEANAFVRGTWGARAWLRRHHYRGEARTRHLRQHKPRLYPSFARDQDSGGRRLPDELLR